MFGNRRRKALRSYQEKVGRDVCMLCVVHDLDRSSVVPFALLAKFLDAASTTNGGMHASFSESESDTSSAAPPPDPKARRTAELRAFLAEIGEAVEKDLAAQSQSAQRSRSNVSVAPPAASPEQRRADKMRPTTASALSTPGARMSRGTFTGPCAICGGGVPNLEFGFRQSGKVHTILSCSQNGYE